MDVQDLEYGAGLRIKFASIDETGGYVDDALEEYETFFDDLPENWVCAEVEGFIDTKFDSDRRGWELRNSRADLRLGAIEHESGIELLVASGLSLGVGLAVPTIVGFVKWAWRRWRSTRSSMTDRLDSSLVIEKVTERSPEGRIKTVNRIEIRGPVDDERAERVIEQMFEEEGA